MTDGHGDDIYRYGKKIIHNFSSNIFTDINHSALMQHLAGCEWCVKRYPEPEPYTLERILASELGVEPENVIVTNGATEAIYLMAQRFRDEASDIIAPTFREYQDACALHSHDIRFIESISEVTAKRGKLVWLCNPNNPTGRVIPAETIFRTSNSNPDKIFIIDQAYALYTSRRLLTAREATDAGNILLLSSLTKEFAVPGLRIGYATGASHIIGELKKSRMPWSVNALAIEAAIYLITHKNDYNTDPVALHREALRLSDGLRKIGIEVQPTDCNFILCRLSTGDAASMKEYLAEHHGILIRDASNFEGLTKRHFRIAAQTPERNDILISAISQWISTCSSSL